MPVDKDPSKIRSGGGVETTYDIRLTEGQIPLSFAIQSSHERSVAAHSAAHITVKSDDTIPRWAKDAQGAIEELSGLPTHPPFLGEPQGGIPDWGVLKLADNSLVDRGLLDECDPAEVFPYYWQAPSPTQVDPEFESSFGSDPATDPLFNSGLEDVAGAGSGKTFAGGYNKDGVLKRTLRIMERPTAIADSGPGVGNPVRQEVVISGKVFPADRGVLALIHWPAEGEFLEQEPLDRVIAALLLGQGVGDCCPSRDCKDRGQDGSPGGIFFNRTGTYPSTGGGQYDLREIHRGVSDLDDVALKPPFDDYTGLGDGKRQIDSEVAGAGQVRLGTDPNSDTNAEHPFPVLPHGIPILGGDNQAYSPIPDLGWEGTQGQARTIGSSIIVDGEGRNLNYFRYRLPYLKDYTNLHRTPSGNNPKTTRESARYFTLPEVHASEALVNAGGYEPYSEDHTPWQIARFRHAFLLPSTQEAGEREEAGSYWLIHFKREHDFERFARDGVMPWDEETGYAVYGMSPLSMESGVVNEETLTTVPSPAGPAPDYGFAAHSYHVLRSSLLLDPSIAAIMPSFSGALTYSTEEAENVVFVSGVAYFTPRAVENGASNFTLSEVSIQSMAPHGFWGHAFRTDSAALVEGGPPAKISSPNPLFLGLAAFGYGGHEDSPISIEADVPYRERQRFEFPYTTLGDYGEDSAPGESDPVALTVEDLELLGDDEEPSFSVDAKVRAYFRRPLGHTQVFTSALPYSTPQGHGVLLGNSDQILMHTTRFDKTNRVGSYGNFLQDGDLPTPGYPQLFTARKDGEERFLDETYRLTSSFPEDGEIADEYGPLAIKALNGPGMGGWIGGPIEVPVRIGHASELWDEISWLQNGKHEEPLTDGLQVRGLPDINPPLSSKATVPFPSAGVLVYPHEDFSGVKPEGGVDFTGDQPSYAGTEGLLTYTRVFDIASEDPEYVKLRLLGVQLEDFAYGTPGPGRLDGLRVELKVPGVTTWMDAGRRDGSGFSKADPLADGAGCQIVGPDTFDGVDPKTGMVFCQVTCYTGTAPFVNRNGGDYKDGSSPKGEMPLLVRIGMVGGTRTVKYNLEHVWSGGDFTVAAQPGASSHLRRGLVGVELVRS